MQSFARPAIVLLISVGILLLAAESFSQQYAGILSGTQKEDTVTLKAGLKPYAIQGEYFVPKGKKIVIEEGVTLIAEKDSELTVGGTISINGSKERPVFIKGKGEGTSFWRGLRFQELEKAETEYVQISNAKIGIHIVNCGRNRISLSKTIITSNGTGLRVVESKPSLVDCIISRNSENGMSLEWGAVSSIRNCTIERNRGWGIFCTDGSTHEIISSIITGNLKGGIRFQGRGTIEVHNCSITGNSDFDVRNDDGKDCDFTSNWWGAEATRKLVAKGDTANLTGIYDGHEDQKLGKVRLHDFLKEEPKNVGAFSSEDNSGTTKDSKAVFVRDSYLISDAKYLNGFYQALSQNNTELVQKYIKRRYVVAISKGTTAKVVTEAEPAYGVKILDGEHKGKQGWAKKQDVEVR